MLKAWTIARSLSIQTSRAQENYFQSLCLDSLFSRQVAIILYIISLCSYSVAVGVQFSTTREEKDRGPGNEIAYLVFLTFHSNSLPFLRQNITPKRPPKWHSFVHRQHKFLVLHYGRDFVNNDFFT